MTATAPRSPRDGRLATTSYDGQVRLYDAAFHLVAKVAAPGGQRPFGIAFSPDGSKLAVGYDDTTAVDLLDGHEPRPAARARHRRHRQWQPVQGGVVGGRRHALRGGALLATPASVQSWPGPMPAPGHAASWRRAATP